MHPNKQRLPIDEIAALYRNGMAAREIAPLYATSPQTILRRLREAGEPLRPQGSWVTGREPIPLDEPHIREMAAQGLSCQEMSAQIGTASEVIRERMVKLGIPRLPSKARPERNYFWKGGRTVDKHGYILVHSPGHPYRTKHGYVREHRLVMERVIGRYLLPTEVVDHIDGDTSNNDPLNLRVFASNRDHLATTLVGHVPKWTPGGLERIRQGNRQRIERQQAASRSESGSGEPSSP